MKTEQHKRELRALERVVAHIERSHKPDYHYNAGNASSPIEDIVCAGRAEDFYWGCLVKYIKRLGKKDGDSVEMDLLKIAHYTMMYLALLEKGVRVSDARGADR